MKQGAIGNCWFISGVAALAEFPGRVEKLFLNNSNELSRTGVYGINFYTLGFPQTIIIDDYLPLVQREDGKYTTLYADISDDFGIWVAIIEKAFAKRYGNYEHIIAGIPSEAIRTLTGSPYTMHEHKDMDVEALWQLLSHHDRNDDFITCGTEGADDTKRNLSGLAKGHAYTMMGTVKLSNGTRLVKIRNPWGSEGFVGAFSDTSSLWDDQSKTEAGYKKADDGIFFTDIETYAS